MDTGRAAGRTGGRMGLWMDGLMSHYGRVSKGVGGPCTCGQVGVSTGGQRVEGQRLDGRTEEAGRASGQERQVEVRLCGAAW